MSLLIPHRLRRRPSHRLHPHTAAPNPTGARLPHPLLELGTAVHRHPASHSGHNAAPPRALHAVPHRGASAPRSRSCLSRPWRGDTRGLPASTLVLDEDTGAAVALVNARTLTALRTASGSVLSATLLHPPSASHPTHIAAFGAGAQIHAHITLLLSSYPTLTHATIINRTSNARLDALLASLRTAHPHTHFATLTSAQSQDVEAAVHVADFICTATSATAPLFPAEWSRRAHT
ncbi:hypothetical protein EVG20_g9465 [Dentipellis fragilis]|uniref:Ornithine cyclodeaminase n=1 Tax=Dentipellis fragilis TaxID=205917 RepID=A0A4Y9XY02_9AGAM|nr:hypothetical protein EVG20_g9465 [Dentipellis fragilis]